MREPSVYDSCATDTECELRLDRAASSLARGSDVGKLIGAECRQGDQRCGEVPICHCVLGGAGGATSWSFSIGGGRECDFYDRAGGCLLPGADVTGCDPADLCSCLEQCERATGLIQEREQSTLEVEARHATCADGRCQVVLRIEDRCFADFYPSPESTSYDCSLGDDEILDLARDAPTSQECRSNCERSLDCGYGVWSGDFYETCSWSTKCGDASVCGTPACAVEPDSGVEECSYPAHQ